MGKITVGHVTSNVEFDSALRTNITVSGKAADAIYEKLASCNPNKNILSPIDESGSFTFGFESMKATINTAITNSTNFAQSIKFWALSRFLDLLYQKAGGRPPCQPRAQVSILGASPPTPRSRARIPSAPGR